MNITQFRAYLKCFKRRLKLLKVLPKHMKIMQRIVANTNIIVVILKTLKLNYL